jgi:hypothetical protein
MHPRKSIAPGRGPLAAMTLAAALLIAIAGRPAVGDDMKYPDWESQWRNPAAGRGGNPWDPGKPMGLGQQAPLTPEYQAIFEASLKDQADGGQGNNYRAACVLSGMPRIMSLAAPMEILIEPTHVLLVFQNALPRHIFTDGRALPADQPASFQGYSIGKWVEPDRDGRYRALEVETRNFTGPRALESTGLPLHRDNETVVHERMFLDPGNNDILHDVVTTIDHAFTRPWTVDKTYVRERHPKWLEYNCQEANNHVFIGLEEFLLSADGKLMPAKKNQPAPDLRYFDQGRK